MRLLAVVVCSLAIGTSAGWSDAAPMKPKEVMRSVSLDRLRLSRLQAHAGAVTLAGARLRHSARPSLAKQARWLATHGGIRSSRYGDATERMKALSRQLVVRQFSRAGSDAVRWASCVADRESGWNPGAVNVTAIAPDYPVAGAGHASGLFQFVTYYHRWVDRWRMLHDPAYAVAAAWRLSNGGRDRSAWSGGGYQC